MSYTAIMVSGMLYSTSFFQFLWQDLNIIVDGN